MQNNDEFTVDTEVLNSFKSRPIIPIIGGIVITLLIVGGVFLFASKQEQYDSVEQVIAENPDGVSDGAVFVVRDKVFKYNSSNDMFSEMKELSEAEQKAIKDIDVSLDVEELEVLRKSINTAQDFSTRKMYEGSYISLLTDLLKMQGDNLNTIQHIYNSYLYSVEFEGVLNNKIAALRSNINDLNIYSMYMLDFISQDDEMFKSNYNSELQALKIAVESEKAKLENLKSNGNLTEDGKLEVQKLIQVYDEALQSDMRALISDGVRDTLQADYRELDKMYNDYMGTFKDLQNVVSTEQLSNDVLQGYLSEYDNYMTEYDKKLSELNTKLNDCTSATEFNKLVREQEELSSSISDAIVTLNTLTETKYSDVAVQESINNAMTSVSDVWSKQVSDLATTVDTLSSQMVQIETELSQCNIAELSEYVTRYETIVSEINRVNNEIDKIEVTDVETKRVLETEREALKTELNSVNAELLKRMSDLEVDTATVEQRLIDLEKQYNNQGVNNETVLLIDKTVKEVNNTLSDAIKELSTKVTNDSVQSNREISELQTSITGVKDSLNTNLGTIGEKVNNLTSDFNAEQIENSEAFSEIKTALSEVKITHTNELNVIDGKIKDLSDKLNNGETVSNTEIIELKTLLNTTQTDLTNDLSGLASRVDTLSNDLNTGVNTNSTSIAELRATITGASDSLNSDLTTVSERVDTLSANLNAEIIKNSNEITRLETLLNESKTSMGTIGSDVSANKTSITGLTTSLSEHKTFTNTLADAVDKNELDIATLNTTVNEYKSLLLSEMGTLTERVNTLSDSLNTEIGKVNTSVQVLEARVDAVDTAITELKADIANIETALADVQDLADANKLDIEVLKTNYTGGKRAV